MELASWNFFELSKPRWVLETRDKEPFKYDIITYVRYGTQNTITNKYLLVDFP